ncbi:HAD-IB family hydrolase/lysophospholipid acyltransferase family protein [Mycobacterium montefiorense]|uniref:L-3-phosphoserine phosphatase n=2 Tax=Mycobacterium montefiorense TaxID=154654 RepID=A0AA37PNI1_9MYCO|nr:HAD-IB family hydrolase/lysophospholipid acyltransferase family protein [Mycobacterium montefiorense]GBG37474.1 L-3-phosphoserine phosphatase [Mycobacterium montefiorense]GKU35726.1 L-3-phosphoserine phosphatase [Mycobacterium montefiorense]GKU38703.1 L-3-phosphoserine phosphatase [Mycobacterium montefiorense]GKU47681.1 L-3-phosphoserine phosphatase [Mycobacterium montefiorense]GKU51707.1 L-3-phosphoserine phosphatase [Mycobacterium montefiorense]
MSRAEEDQKAAPAKDLRLPGSVAEILASPEGPKIGAFFDLDGTLVAGFTAVILTQERLRRRDMGVGELLSMVQAGLNHTLGRIEFEDLIGKASAALAGRLLTDLDEIGERLFAQRIESRIYPEMRELVRAHVARGHTVVLSSSALTIQVNPVARFLGIVNTLTNRFETNEDGLLTGSVVEPILWGPGKAAAVQRFAAENSIDLKDSYFYADGDEDVALMYLVGNPRPTNPEGKMAAVAKRRGWPILRFSSRGPVGLRRQLRTLAGFGSMFPVGAGAVAVGVLTGSRRRGVNFFTSNFSQAVLAATGVHLNVIGKDNLTAQRPAVFIFNHRNQVDPIISGALIRDNWVAVGKKELERDPIMGTLGKLLDGVFIDRDDHGAALETMQTVEDRAKNGLSILMAPEGTRLDTTEVGPFKKGPFRLAMAAGIPVVPIVIRNAEIVAARNSTTINPGTVDVAVFPPIPVQDWTVETLPDRIAEVRQLYLDTLANWPVDELPQVDLYAEKKAAKKARARSAAKAAGTKAPAKKTRPKKATAKPAAKSQPAQPNPNESEVALKDGEAPRPDADQPGGAGSTSRPRGRT